MKNQNKIIIGIIVIVILVIVGVFLVSNYIKKMTNREGSRYSWENKGEGVWVRRDLECKYTIDYMCISNCYTTIPACPFDPNIVENATTPDGTKVTCFKHGCTFQDCDIICPLG